MHPWSSPEVDQELLCEWRTLRVNHFSTATSQHTSAHALLALWPKFARIIKEVYASCFPLLAHHAHRLAGDWGIVQVMIMRMIRMMLIMRTGLLVTGGFCK